MELWRPIDGLEIYEISSCGRIRRNGTKYLSGSINNRGYLRYDLCLNGKRIVKSAHRLVADAFIPNPDGKPFINHIDGDKTTNSVTNLEWCDRLHNEREARRLHIKSYTQYIVEFDNGDVRKYEFVIDLANELKVSGRTILNYLQGKTKGYVNKGIASIRYLE